MIRRVLVAVALAACATAVIAQADPIAERKAAMKSVGAATGDVAKMLKGELAFDLAKAQAALKTYSEVAKKMPALYPETSKTGGDTSAAPKVWEDAAGFKAAFAKFDKEAGEAAAAVKDEASFKTALPNVLKNCGSCHEAYRVKKS